MKFAVKIILCDELNRADNVVFKNMMNVILERVKLMVISFLGGL